MEGRLTKQEIEAVDKAYDIFLNDKNTNDRTFIHWFDNYKASIAIEKEKYQHALEVFREFHEDNTTATGESYIKFIERKLEE